MIGGSSASTPEFVDAIEAWLDSPDRRPELILSLIGRTEVKLAVVAAACRERLTGAGRRVSIESTTDRQAGLQGADLVLNQSRAGGLAARDFDESFPHLAGIPGEETMGPGGFANAMRTVPAMHEVWRDIEAAAPEALVLNLTNPAGIVVQAAQRSTSLRVISICDGPLTLLDAVAERLGVPREEIRSRYVGMNHVGWYVPRVAAELEVLADLATGIDPAYVRACEALPFTYLRYYAHPDRILAAQVGHQTRASQLKQRERELLSSFGEGHRPDLASRAFWYGGIVVPFIDAWANGSEVPIVVGVQNGGLVRGLPDDAVIEIAHMLRRPGELVPLDPPTLPAYPQALLAAHAAYEGLATTAALADGTGDESIRAILSNPMVRTFDQAQVIARELRAPQPA